jgi:hypothetical protein
MEVQVDERWGGDQGEEMKENGSKGEVEEGWGDYYSNANPAELVWIIEYHYRHHIPFRGRRGGGRGRGRTEKMKQEEVEGRGLWGLENEKGM